MVTMERKKRVFNKYVENISQLLMDESVHREEEKSENHKFLIIFFHHTFCSREHVHSSLPSANDEKKRKEREKDSMKSF